MLIFQLGFPWWVTLLIAVAIFLFGAEIGFRFGRRLRHAKASWKSHVAMEAGAILALLGLLLAFSFSIVEARFTARKALVIDEANAIGTAYLRAKTLPEPQAHRIQALLRQYVNIRLAASTPESLARQIQRSEQLHDDLWREAVTVAKAHPDSEVVGRFLEALNAVIDLHTTRVTVSLYQHLPDAIFNILVVVSLLAMVILGYGAGLGRWRSPLPTAALVVAIASVIVLIHQLDTPGTRLFRISQYAMEDVQETITADARRAQPVAGRTR